MSKYAPGNHLLALFDRIGTKTKTVPIENVTDGFAKGDAAKQNAEANSYVILRVIHNSAMPELERYDVRNLK